MYSDIVPSFVTTQSFSLRNNSYADSVRIGLITILVKPHNKIMAALCICCGESKSRFYNLWTKKCVLFEIESIIKSLMNSNLEINSLKKKEIFLRGVTSGERFK